MMDANDSSEEREREELEIALYSQIHFGSDSTDKVQKSKKQRLSSRLSNRSLYNVGIQELPLRVVQASKKMSLSMQDFIAFSDESESPHIDNNEQEAYGESSENAASMSLASGLEIAEAIKNLKTEVLDLVIDGASKQRTEDVKGAKSLKSSKEIKLETDVKREIVLFADLSNANVKMENTLSEMKTEVQAIDMQHENSDEVLNLLQDDVPEQFMVDDDIIDVDGIIDVDDYASTARNDRNERSSKKDKSKMSIKVKDDLLPFTITKTASRVIEPTAQMTETARKKQEASKTNASRLKDFLRLPESSNTEEEEIKLRKQKKISKLHAAIKPVKPPVKLRRPAVVVKYREHSDTDTEYSDSDSSEECQEERELPMVATEEKTSIMEEADNPEVEDQDKALEAKDLKEDSEESVDESEEEASDEADESSSDSSESVSDSSLPDGQLDFNLDGGLNALLKSSKSEDTEKWQINEKDRFNVTSTMSRYFCPRTITCRNCDEEGHLSRDCSKPLSRRCIFCGIKGHVYQNCPNAICRNCDAPGHRANQCEKPWRNKWEVCTRCKTKGHNVETCPDKLRQYHRTVDPQCLWPTRGKTWKNPRVYCYNCGCKGHLGHVCKAPRMNAYVNPSNPFVIHYDSKRQYMKEQSKLRRSIRKQEKTRSEKEHSQKLSHKDRKMLEQSGQYSSRYDCFNGYNDTSYQSWSKRHRRSSHDFRREYNDHYESRDDAGGHDHYESRDDTGGHDHYESRDNTGGHDHEHSSRSETHRKERKRPRYESAEWSGRKRERISDEGRGKDRGVTLRFESLEVSIPQNGVKTVKKSRAKNEREAYEKPWPPRDGHSKPTRRHEVYDQYGSSGGKIQGSEFQWEAGQEDGEIIDDNDMEGYQVADNEWWKKPKSKKRKRGREWDSERQTHASPREQQYQRESYMQDDYNWQQDEMEYRDSSFEERQRHYPSSTYASHKRQHSFDAAFYPEPYGSRHKDHFPSSNYSTAESRKRKHPPQEKSPRDSGSHPSRTQPLLPTPVMTERPPRSDRQGLSHSRSWPSLKTKRNASGFRSQNSRFIKMSNDYNTSVNIRR